LGPRGCAARGPKPWGIPRCLVTPLHTAKVGESIMIPGAAGRNQKKCPFQEHDNCASWSAAKRLCQA
jgi:hypothetical protein